MKKILIIALLPVAVSTVTDTASTPKQPAPVYTQKKSSRVIGYDSGVEKQNDTSYGHYTE